LEYTLVLWPIRQLIILFSEFSNFQKLFLWNQKNSEYLRIFNVLKWIFQNSLTFRCTCVEMAKVLQWYAIIVGPNWDHVPWLHKNVFSRMKEMWQKAYQKTKKIPFLCLLVATLMMWGSEEDINHLKEFNNRIIIYYIFNNYFSYHSNNTYFLTPTIFILSWYPSSICLYLHCHTLDINICSLDFQPQITS